MEHKFKLEVDVSIKSCRVMQHNNGFPSGVSKLINKNVIYIIIKDAAAVCIRLADSCRVYSSIVATVCICCPSKGHEGGKCAAL